MVLSKKFSSQPRFKVVHPNQGTKTIKACQYEEYLSKGWSDALPDFSVKSNSGSPIVFDRAKVDAIKQKYGFGDDIDLYSDLNELHDWWKSFKTLSYQRPRHSESKSLTEELIVATESFAASALYLKNIINRLGQKNRLLLLNSSCAREIEKVQMENYNQTNIYFKKRLPTNLLAYKNTYIFLINKLKLLYVDHNGDISDLEFVAEFEKIKIDVEELNLSKPINNQVPNPTLKKIWELVRANPGHNHIKNPVSEVQKSLEKFNREDKYWLNQLKSICVEATKQIPSDGTGRSSNNAEQSFMCHLAWIYKDGTRKELSASTNYKNRGGQTYCGDFFNFVKEINSILKIFRSDSAIGELAIKIRNQVKTK